MTTETLQDLIDSLDDLLEAERAAVLEGDLDSIARLLDRKEMLIDEISVADASDSALLATINAKAARNQVLLNSALDGIRTVSRRLAALRRIRGSLDTYDASGRKSSIDVSTDRSVEKRA